MSRILGYNKEDGHFEPCQVDTRGNLLVASAMLGTQANLFDDDTVLANATSSVFDMEHLKSVDILGQGDTSGVLEVQFSGDNTNWYKSSYSVSAVGGSDFHLHLDNINVRYLRLKSVPAQTITASAFAKS